jgi:quinoprotein glucose dehydrogenase
MIPVYKDGGILINDGVSKLTKLDSITGKIIWSRTFPESPVAKRGLIIHNNTVFFPSGNMLRAIDFTSGKDENIFNNSPNLELETLSFIEPKIWNKSKLIAVSNDSVIYIIDINLGKVVQQSAIVSDAEPTRAGSLDSIYKNPRIWGGVALDDARGILYLTTSNPSPTLVGVDRPGKNKYSSSIVAFDLVKSMVIWDFQDVAHDLWDYDIAAPPVLAQIPINDKKMDVVVAIGKTGNIYVLDRDTGKSVHNLKYIRTPVSKVLGEKTSPYQKYSIKPENLLGFYNTEVLIGGEWKKIFFEPPRIDEYIKVKGLHGGVNWPGFAASNDKVLVAVSHDKTLIALKDSKLGSVEGLIRNPECDGCHNNKIQKDISTFFGTRTREDFSNIILNGYQGMPAQKVEAGRLSKIVDYLVGKNSTSRDHLKSVNKSLVKKRYIKSKKDKTQTAELILLDIGKGEILWRLPIDKNEYGLTLAGTAFINNSYGVVTGGLDKKVLIVDIGSSKVSTEIQLDYIGSATPLTFQNENSVFMLIPETGSSTLNRYDKAKLIGNKFTLYKIGSID